MSYSTSSDHPAPLGGGRGRPNIYPLKNLEIGQSFFVPCTTDEEINSVRVSAQYYQRKLKRRFVTRLVEGGIRVWRVEKIDLSKNTDIDFVRQDKKQKPPPENRTATVSTLAAGDEPNTCWITLDIHGMPPSEHLIALDGPVLGRIVMAAATARPVRSLADLAGVVLQVVTEAGKPVRLATGEPL
jgi:hypothetical protein